MICWMEAYGDGKSAKDAQFEVKKYGSQQYKSHRKSPTFDRPLTN